MKFLVTLLFFTLFHLPKTSAQVTTNDLNFDFVGNSFIESNSPEVIQGAGYIFRHDIHSQDRGTHDSPLLGCTDLYFFHINKSNYDLHFHLVLKSKKSSTNASFVGSSYTNAEKLLGKNQGQSYGVASDWLTGKYNNNKTISLNTEYQSILIKEFPKNSMIDGRFKICSSEQYYISIIASHYEDSKLAIGEGLAQSAKGIIMPVTPNTYGRVAAIFNRSKINGKIEIKSGLVNQKKKWHFNTISKFDEDRDLQDQTMQCIYNISDSSCQSNGNYGRVYDLSLEIKNNLNVCKSYDVIFESNLKRDVDIPSFTWNCPILVNNKLVPTYNTPTKPSQLIATINIMAKSERNIPIKIIPCGLITAKQNLQIEEKSCETKEKAFNDNIKNILEKNELSSEESN